MKFNVKNLLTWVFLLIIGAIFFRYESTVLEIAHGFITGGLMAYLFPPFDETIEE